MFAILALHRDESVKVDAYGITFWYELGREYAWAYAYLNPSQPINRTIEEAIATAAAFLRDKTSWLTVYGAEHVFRHGRRERVENKFASMRIRLLPAGIIRLEQSLALEAVRTKSTKIEIFS